MKREIYEACGVRVNAKDYVVYSRGSLCYGGQGCPAQSSRTKPTGLVDFAFHGLDAILESFFVFCP